MILVREKGKQFFAFGLIIHMLHFTFLYNWSTEVKRNSLEYFHEGLFS